MSADYEMTVEIRGVRPDRAEAVQEAAAFEWPFESWDPLSRPGNPRDFGSRARDSLYGSEAPDEFAERLVRAIWKANGRYCRVEVRSLYLEQLPVDTYDFDEAAYEELAGISGEPHTPAPKPEENQRG